MSNYIPQLYVNLIIYPLPQIHFIDQLWSLWPKRGHATKSFNIEYIFCKWYIWGLLRRLKPCIYAFTIYNVSKVKYV